MLTFFTVVHVLLSVFMIFVILLQPGKDAGMGAALGGGAATSAFGGRGAATFLTKLTAGETVLLPAKMNKPILKTLTDCVWLEVTFPTKKS